MIDIGRALLFLLLLSSHSDLLVMQSKTGFLQLMHSRVKIEFCSLSHLVDVSFVYTRDGDGYNNSVSIIVSFTRPPPQSFGYPSIGHVVY